MSRTPPRVHPALWVPVVLVVLALGTTGCTARNLNRTGSRPNTSPCRPLNRSPSWSDLLRRRLPAQNRRAHRPRPRPPGRPPWPP